MRDERQLAPERTGVASFIITFSLVYFLNILATASFILQDNSVVVYVSVVHEPV